MNPTAVDSVVTELFDDHQPAEVMGAWADRPSDVD